MAHPGHLAPIGHPYIILPTIDSTNNYAMRQIQAGLASHGATWFAREQTAGKGQRGKSWLTTPNQNIMLSTVITPGLMPTRQFWLSATIAIACYDFYKKYAGDETRIKWPNDVYWRDRKAGGILIENVFRGSDWLYAVVGIGINVNQVVFDSALPNPVSLKQITGKDFDAAEMGIALCQSLENRYQELHTVGIGAIMQQYQQVLYKIHEPVTLKKGTILFETTIQGVSDNGRLLTKDVIEREFDFGEVEFIIR